MFTTLNQRWLIELHEREVRVMKRIANNPQPPNWFQKLMHWFKHPT